MNTFQRLVENRKMAEKTMAEQEIELVSILSAIIKAGCETIKSDKYLMGNYYYAIDKSGKPVCQHCGGGEWYPAFDLQDEYCRDFNGAVRTAIALRNSLTSKCALIEIRFSKDGTTSVYYGDFCACYATSYNELKAEALNIGIELPNKSELDITGNVAYTVAKQVGDGNTWKEFNNYIETLTISNNN